MSGIYIHIPFCKSRCIYCGFYSTTGMEQRQRYVNALCCEWQLRQHELTEPLTTIYLGGGTPSQLTAPQLEQIFSTLPTASSEVTIEVNPDDVSAQYAAIVSQLGINRVSMGAQTFNDQRLRFLHRRHTAAQVADAVGRLRDAGISNISIDLMYGFPDETLDDWQHDIDQALALGVEHLSAYCLMVEEGTMLQRMGIEPCDEETERQMYECLMDRMAAAGYEHYEISNFARPGFRSRHNSSYWNDTPYIGLGTAAHSYAPPPLSCGLSLPDRGTAKRSWNVSDIQQYMAAIEQGQRPYEEEILDDDTCYNDRITTALRTSNGLDLSTLSTQHRRYCLREARRFIEDELLRQDGSRLVLTRRGLFVSDMVMASLMLV